MMTRMRRRQSMCPFRRSRNIQICNIDLAHKSICSIRTWMETDSLVNPIVGVALIKTETSTEIIRAKQNEGYDYRQYEWLITFAPSNGRWKPIRWTSKLVDSSDKNDSGLGIEKRYGIPQSIRMTPVFSRHQPPRSQRRGSCLPSLLWSRRTPKSISGIVCVIRKSDSLTIPCVLKVQILPLTGSSEPMVVEAKRSVDSLKKSIEGSQKEIADLQQQRISQQGDESRFLHNTIRFDQEGCTYASNQIGKLTAFISKHPSQISPREAYSLTSTVLDDPEPDLIAYANKLARRGLRIDRWRREIFHEKPEGRELLFVRRAE